MLWLREEDFPYHIFHFSFSIEDVFGVADTRSKRQKPTFVEVNEKPMENEK
jgi:hypothetical protein